METNEAVLTLAALAQSTRLAAFRYLVQAGPKGAPAGEVADALGVAPATLSFHLKELEHAGLVVSKRQGRHIYYSAGYGAMRGLMDYLTEDCCQGHPEICRPLAQRAKKENAA